MNPGELKPHFSRFLGAAPGRLHFAAHSHHPWPDVTFEAQQQAWLDAARLMDDKWDEVFARLLPGTAALIAGRLGLSDPSAIAFAPSTHALVMRILSSLLPTADGRPLRVLTTDAEFHSFARQAARLEEDGLADVERVPVEPFGSFPDRFARAAAAGGRDLVYLSHVLFSSAYLAPDLAAIVAAVPDERTVVVVDGYHSFMAVPTDLAAIERRAFYLAGGYKYAMAGEGACFAHCPPGYVARPRDTGWFAGFSGLPASAPRAGAVPYAADGSRLAGGTLDPTGLYRMRAVLSWLERAGVSVADIHAHVRRLQARFLAGGDHPGLLPPEGAADRGNFLTFRFPAAPAACRALHDRGVIADHRADRLRIGFGLYHDDADVDALLEHLAGIPQWASAAQVQSQTTAIPISSTRAAGS